MSEKTKSEKLRSKNTNEKLDELIPILEDTLYVLKRVRNNGESMTNLCRDKNLDLVRIGRLVNFVGKVRLDEAVNVNELFPKQEPYEILYKDILSQSRMHKRIILPPDYKETVDYVLHKALSKRDAEYMFRRYGLDTGMPETLESIAASDNLTRERIRQIVNKSLDILRRYHYSSMLVMGLDAYNKTQKKDVEMRKKYIVNAVKEAEEKRKEEDTLYTKFSELKDDSDYLKQLRLSCKSIDIDRVGIPYRAYNALKNYGINNVYDLLMMDKNDFSQIANFGAKCYKETMESCEKFTKEKFGISHSKFKELFAKLDDENGSKTPITGIHINRNICKRIILSTDDLSLRVINSLKKINVKNVYDLIMMPDTKIATVKNLGIKGCNEITHFKNTFSENTFGISPEKLRQSFLVDNIDVSEQTEKQFG